MQKRLIPLFDGHIVAAEAIAQDFVGNRPYIRVEGGISKVLFRLQAMTSILA